MDRTLSRGNTIFVDEDFLNLLGNHPWFYIYEANGEIYISGTNNLPWDLYCVQTPKRNRFTVPKDLYQKVGFVPGQHLSIVYNKSPFKKVIVRKM